MTRRFLLPMALAALVVVAWTGLGRAPVAEEPAVTATASSWLVQAFPVGQARFARSRG